MNKSLYTLLFFFSCCFLACDDLMVENISKDTVKLISPGKNLVLDNGDVTLVWETLEGADNYHVIVVSPSFEKVKAYVCDSVTEDYKLKISLNEGIYEWSVEARNSGYTSLKSIGTFEIGNHEE